MLAVSTDGIVFEILKYMSVDSNEMKNSKAKKKIKIQKKIKNT